MYMKKILFLLFFIISTLTSLFYFSPSVCSAKVTVDNFGSKTPKEEIGAGIDKKQKKMIEAVSKKMEDAEISQPSHGVDTTNNKLTHLFTLLVGAEFDESYSEEEVVMLKDELGVGDGAAATIGHAMAYLYESPPASVKSYVADVFQNAKIIPPAYAQGLGFSSLHPVLGVWKTFLNLSYAFLAVIILIIGFMIMFRAQIGGQTAVTAQQAIPNVIIALLTTTLSYPLAGVLVEAMYLIMQLMIVVFKPGSGVDLISFNFLQLGASFMTGSESVWSPISETVNQFVDSLIGENLVSTGLGAISSLLVQVIYAFAIVVMIFKLFFQLLKSYVTIVLNIALAPMILMIGAIPGKNTFTNWIKQIAGHLMAFPTVLLVIIIYQILTDSMSTGGGFMPPYLIGGGAGNAPIFLVGLGLLLATPAVVKEVVNAIAPESSFFTSILKEAGDTMKSAAPMGTRLAGMGAGYGVGGLAGGAQAAWRGRHALRRDIQSGDIGEGIQDYWGKVSKGAKKGGRAVASPLARAGDWLEGQPGYNTPRSLSGLTRAMQKAYLTDEEQKKKDEDRRTTSSFAEALENQSRFEG